MVKKAIAAARALVGGRSEAQTVAEATRDLGRVVSDLLALAERRKSACGAATTAAREFQDAADAHWREALLAERVGTNLRRLLEGE